MISLDQIGLSLKFKKDTSSFDRDRGRAFNLTIIIMVMMKINIMMMILMKTLQVAALLTNNIKNRFLFKLCSFFIFIFDNK